MKCCVMWILAIGSAGVCWADDDLEKAGAKRTIQVEFDAPATNYLLRIQEVYRLDDELWVISKVSTDPHDEQGGDAITRVSDQITIEADEDLQLVHWIVGKDWNWGDDTKSLRYANHADVKGKLKEQMGVRIWQRPLAKTNDAGQSVTPTLRDLLRILRSSSNASDARDD